MQHRPTASRVPDPGIRELFTREARWQSWLDVEAALARAEAELDMIPADAAVQIAEHCRLELLDMEKTEAILAVTAHPLVPLIWELDRILGDEIGGYVHWGATTQNITQTGDILQLRKAHEIIPGSDRAGPGAARALGRTSRRRSLRRTHARSARGAGHVRIQGRRMDRRALPTRRAIA